MINPSFASENQLKIIAVSSVVVDEKIEEDSHRSISRGSWEGEPVAIKIVKIQVDDKIKEGLVEESIKIASLVHPNILTLVGILSSYQGYITELMEESLHDAIKNQKLQSWSLRKKVEIIRNIASGIIVLHEQGITLRNLNSMKVLLKNEEAKLMPFDFTVFRGDENEVSMKPAWMAPEQLQGKEAFSIHSNTYSLGMILWEIFHERPPFEEFSRQTIFTKVERKKNHETIATDLPKAISNLIEDCWKKSKKRPAMHDFLGRLDTYVGTLPLDPISESSSSSESPPPRYSEVFDHQAPLTPPGPFFPASALSGGGHLSVFALTPQSPPSSPEVPEWAFGASAWRTFFGDVGKEPPLPSNIQEVLDDPCPFWPGKKVKETHLLVLIPQSVKGKPLTLNSFQELIKKPKSCSGMRYSSYHDGVRRKIGNQETTDSHWVLMTKDVIPGSRNQPYSAQQTLIKRYYEYELPKLLDATVVILTHMLKAGELTFTNVMEGRERTFAFCKEDLADFAEGATKVGCFSGSGLIVSHGSGKGHPTEGIAATRNFH